jgi:hypothetical protein
MSDRKYRQRGYQDDERPRGPRGPQGPKPPRPPQERAPGRVLQDERGPKTPNLMGMHEVFKCARCGNKLPLSVELVSKCSRCGVDLHSCIQCVSFDTSARWECTQSSQLSQRVAPKDEGNICAMFTPRTTIERQTGSPTSSGGGGESGGGSSSARKAFDDLFK